MQRLLDPRGRRGLPDLDEGQVEGGAAASAVRLSAGSKRHRAGAHLHVGRGAGALALRAGRLDFVCGQDWGGANLCVSLAPLDVAVLHGPDDSSVGFAFENLIEHLVNVAFAIEDVNQSALLVRHKILGVRGARGGDAAQPFDALLLLDGAVFGAFPGLARILLLGLPGPPLQVEHAQRQTIEAHGQSRMQTHPLGVRAIDRPQARHPPGFGKSRPRRVLDGQHRAEGRAGPRGGIRDRLGDCLACHPLVLDEAVGALYAAPLGVSLRDGIGGLGDHSGNDLSRAGIETLVGEARREKNICPPNFWGGQVQGGGWLGLGKHREANYA